jgi:hypothetical protein
MNAYNFFKFLEKTDNRKTPFLVKLALAPEELTPEELHIKRSLILSPLSDFYFEEPISLPDNMTIEGNFILDGVYVDGGILPNGLVVKGNLEIDFCYITELPSDMIIGGDVHIESDELVQTYYGSPEEVKRACPGIKGKVYMPELDYR